MRVDLLGAKPPIWRRLEIPGAITLGDLHYVLQAAFDWDGSHPHEFIQGRARYGVLDDDSFEQLEDEEDVTVEQLLKRTGARLDYLYDFGEHRIVVERIDMAASRQVAVCTGGRRAAPFEDSGGVGGYEYICAARANPDRPEHAEYAQWVDQEPGAVTFDPGAFDMSTLNRVLARIEIG